MSGWRTDAATKTWAELIAGLGGSTTIHVEEARAAIDKMDCHLRAQERRAHVLEAERYAARIELDSAKAQAKASEAAAAEAIRTRDACLSRERDTVARTTDHDREIQDLRAALESTRIEAARQAHRAKVWRAAALAG